MKTLEIPEDLSSITTLEDALSVIKTLLEVNRQQAQTISKLESEVEDLKERLNTNSNNSSLPPSFDKKKKNKLRSERRKRSGKRRGAQKGRKGVSKKLSPPEEVTSFIPCPIPSDCSSCGGKINPLGYLLPPSGRRYSIPH